jgi:phosphoenolpyruvate-protein kinase (PTS system EI component)
MKLKRSIGNRQLELPVLANVKATTTRQPNAEVILVGKQQGVFSQAASEQDLMIYEEIADNYFKSLKDS